MEFVLLGIAVGIRRLYSSICLCCLVVAYLLYVAIYRALSSVWPGSISELQNLC